MALLEGFKRTECNAVYREALARKDAELLRLLARKDLFFCLTVALNRQDANRDWIFARCREVEAHPDYHLDLWAREHYKSTIITFAKTVQDICDSHGDGADRAVWPQELTAGIFSCTRPIAKGFLIQIMREAENNDFLKRHFEDVFWDEPRRQAPKWSEDGGIIFKRRGNPKEATVEAWGLVDGQPTSRHFGLQVYDDIVTLESVTTPEQIEKVTRAWEISLNLGTDGGKIRYIGTRYHYNDTYATMMKRGSATVRTYAATHDGTMRGDPVLISPEALSNKLRDMGSYTFACQMLLNPKEDAAMNFSREWLRFYALEPEEVARGMNIYILVDAASAKKKGSDSTAMMVVGLGHDQNKYLLDGLRAKLNLTERTRRLFSLVRKWKPIRVGYEKYGAMSDIEHIQEEQERENFRFDIVALGGAMPKDDRIRRLVPDCEQSRFLLPRRIQFKDEEGQVRNLVQLLIDDEYDAFPVAQHDDMLDATSRIYDEDLRAEYPSLRADHQGRRARKLRRY